VLFSDFTDPTSAELMIENVGRLVERHRDVRGHGRCRACRDRRRAARDMQAVAMAVTATALARQRALVLQRLRAPGRAWWKRRTTGSGGCWTPISRSSGREASDEQALMSTLAQRVTGWFSKTEEQAAAASEAALRSDRFRLEREADWKRLEAIVTHGEGGCAAYPTRICWRCRCCTAPPPPAFRSRAKPRSIAPRCPTSKR
jgi:hypothetical protein